MRVALFRLRDPEPWARRALAPDGLAIAGESAGRACEALLRAAGPLPRRDGSLELVRDETVTLTAAAATRRTGGDESAVYDSSDSDEGTVETRWVHAGRWADQRVSLGVLPEGLYLARVHAGAYAASALVSVSGLTLLVRRGDRHDTAVAASDPRALTGRDVGMIRKVLASFVTAHGAPGSARRAATRAAQARDVALPTLSSQARAIRQRAAYAQVC